MREQLVQKIIERKRNKLMVILKRQDYFRNVV